MIAPTNCNPYCDCAQRLVRCQRAAPVEFTVNNESNTPELTARIIERRIDASHIIEKVKAEKAMNECPPIAEVKECLDQLPERRKIFTYDQSAFGQVMAIVRESDGSVSVTLRTYSGTVTMGVPAAQWRKMIAAFAIEPDLWPGAEYSRPWYEETEAGNPHGDPLA